MNCSKAADCGPGKIVQKSKTQESVKMYKAWEENLMMSGEEGAGMLHKVTMPLFWRGGEVKMRTHHQEPRSKDRERKGVGKWCSQNRTWRTGRRTMEACKTLRKDCRL